MEKSRLAVAYSHFFCRFSSHCTFAKLAKYELSTVLVLGSSQCACARYAQIDVSLKRDRLPAETQARLTFDELRVLLKLHMRWIHDKGLQPADVIDRPQDITDVIVLGEETLTAYLLGKAEESRIEVLDDVDVVHVVRAHLAYFEMIGAVGPSASSNDL